MQVFAVRLAAKTLLADSRYRRRKVTFQPYHQCRHIGSRIRNAIPRASPERFSRFIDLGKLATLDESWDQKRFILRQTRLPH